MDELAYTPENLLAYTPENLHVEFCVLPQPSMQGWKNCTASQSYQEGDGRYNQVRAASIGIDLEDTHRRI